MKNIKKYIFTILIVSLISCDNFLDIEPKGLIIPSTLEDYDLMLNDSNELYFVVQAIALGLSSDNFKLIVDGSGQNQVDFANNQNLQYYTWHPLLYENASFPYQPWQNPYQSIYIYNLILDEIENAEIVSGYKESDRSRIEAETKVSRAHDYWLLVNTFAKQYNAATASSDLGVPLITNPNPSGETTSRQSVEEVYNFIIDEIQSSLEFLPSNAVNRFRMNKGAAHAILARIYLSKNDYSNALIQANLALEENDYIGNYHTVLDSLTEEYESENYLTRYSDNSGASLRSGVALPLSDELVALYDSTDYRINKVFTFRSGEYQFNSSFVALKTNAPSVPEMYLIRAEVMARNGQIQEALDNVHLIRQKRIPEEIYQRKNAADFTSDFEALKFVLDERRRELFIKPFRLFDIKRYNLETNLAKAITHEVLGESFTVQPGDDNLIFPIPMAELLRSPSLKQNPRD